MKNLFCNLWQNPLKLTGNLLRNGFAINGVNISVGVAEHVGVAVALLFGCQHSVLIIGKGSMI